ncbi:hypothetical protein ASD24_26880 [Paenibacillus sp. Root52]|uniref:hypothetical protein n=1 Tax=Paenibacillus sp. Root52 TaxID=1736552 RepID=UPI0006F812E5|nr:hypothetical protein [Paenibacillus sp. Root52]KQY87102.1 hypothetical protein ASD24_26880 [Paenibacillus sp. Root52]
MSIIKKWGYILSACFVALLILLNSSREQELEDYTPPTPEVEIIMDSLSDVAFHWEMTNLSPEQFHSRYLELTGEDFSQLKGQPASYSSNIYHAEYTALVDLGAGVDVQTGFLAEIEEVRDGSEIQREFRQVYENTSYLTPEDSNSTKLVQNYVMVTRHDQSRVQVSLNAYADWLSSEGQRKHELGVLSAEELRQQHWFPMESMDGSDKGFRRYFSGSGWVKL